MFLAHFTGWGHGEIMEMALADLYFWVNEAYKLNNEMNKPATK